VTGVFPLIHSNNLLSKPRQDWKDFTGRRSFNEADHPLPIVGSKLNEYTQSHAWNHYELFLNPNLIESVKSLPSTEEYAGKRSGVYVNHVGWLKIGGTRKYLKHYSGMRKGFAIGQWQERNMTPRFMYAPRVSPGGPRVRYQGKLTYHGVRLSKIIWAIDTGRLNPNEVITIYTLRQANVIAEYEVVWPGVSLITGGVERVPYPLSFELQSASRQAIELVEKAGGTFVSAYLTHRGIVEELHPDIFPVVLDQDLPDPTVMSKGPTDPTKRGYLAQWYADEGKFAHPAAGRRMAHYVRPPQDRDVPSTLEEYELVKHHQKWHFNQPGTGTLLPWHTMDPVEKRRTSGRL
jgi:ribosomal protein L15